MTNLREDFPALNQKVYGHSLVYLDSAATTLKPKAVIDRLNQYHSYETANVHRGAHYLSDVGTSAYEQARKTVAEFINAKTEDEIVFTYGTTDGINLLATTLGQSIELNDKKIVVTEMEHHANLVPWHLLAERTGVKVVAIPVDSDGNLDMAAAEKIIDKNTAIVSLVHISNSSGAVNDVDKICQMAKSAGAISIIDAAQSIACMPIDVQKMDCDFLVFSAHKIFGPYGIGALYGKSALLQKLPPYRGGGAMIEKVEIDKSSYLPAPHRFEAGTPNIPGVIGMGAAIEYVKNIGFDSIQNAEKELLGLAKKKLSAIDGLHFFCTPKQAVNILSFTTDWGHAADIGQILDQQGIAIRVGHHCTQPLLRKFNLTSVARASFSIYSDSQDVEKLYQGLIKCKELLS